MGTRARRLQRPTLRVVRVKDDGTTKVWALCHTDTGARRKLDKAQRAFPRDTFRIEQRPAVRVVPPAPEPRVSTPASVAADMKRAMALATRAADILARAQTKEG